jgi:branched-chain amino acid aminotransferase
VLELCAANGIPHEVRDLTTTDVYRAAEVFCTGTMGELVGATEVDGRTIGTGEVGPLTRRLTDLYRREVAATGYPVV